jgi:hypothetical protein
MDMVMDITTDMVTDMLTEKSTQWDTVTDPFTPETDMLTTLLLRMVMLMVTNIIEPAKPRIVMLRQTKWKQSMKTPKEQPDEDVMTTEPTTHTTRMDRTQKEILFQNLSTNSEMSGSPSSLALDVTLQHTLYVT